MAARIWAALRLIALVLCLAAPMGAVAQDQETPDYAAWSDTATDAEGLLSDGGATNAELEALRVDLAEWREMFLEQQSANQARIDTVQDQLSALGDPPAEGDSEPDAIAERREALNAQLAEIQAPRLEAEEAYNRASGLIREVDDLLRARQTDELLQLGPSPLNPVHWPGAVSAMAETGRIIAGELHGELAEPRGQSDFWRNLPIAVLFFGIAALLLARGRGWMITATSAMARKWQGYGRGVFVFVVSLGQVAVPVVGIMMLARGIGALSVLGPYSQAIVDTLVVLGLTFYGGRWLGMRVFPADAVMSSALDFSERARGEARFYAGTLGLLFGLAVMLGRLIELSDYPPGTVAVLAFPLIALTGLVLVRMGQLLAREVVPQEPGEEIRFASRIARLMGQVVMVLGALGPLLAAVGYLNAAGAVTFPATLSLALIAFLAILYFFFRDLYALLRRIPAEEADQTLMPVLLTLVATLASLPVFALIWGARRTDIAEVWARFREGFAVGDTRISPADFLTFAVVFALGYMVTRMVQSMLRSTVLPKTRMDPGGQNAVTSGLGYVGIFLAALAAITGAGIDLSNLAIVAGALSVGIGFGLQTIVSNFVSGIILLIERPISKGDWIEVGGRMGIVQDISVRSTRIETFDRTDVIVPNADFVSGTVTNWTRGNHVGRVTLSVGVAYGSDSRKVEKILREICDSHPMVAIEPEPAVYFRRFGPDALEFDCFCILRDVNYLLAVHSELNHQVHERFKEEGIEIPFAQRDVWLRNPETLPRSGQGQGKPDAPREIEPPRENTVRAPDTWDEGDGDADAPVRDGGDGEGDPT
ncbi:DUF3772 domain-containing protein [Mesobaculum littorinae]|nr:DUF3772 domain-containing protein [Mesobaculum littorinae]